MKAIVIGRHEPSGKEGIEIVGMPRNISFPAAAEDCHRILWDLLQEAILEDCKLILQGTPFQVAAALHNIIADDTRFAGIVGGIVNVPGPRLAGLKSTFFVDAPHDANTVAQAIRFVNPRAKIEEIEGAIHVTVDPPMRFEFSHIQWLDGSTTNWSIRGFFDRFGLPQEWIDKDGDILINESDSNEYPDINSGDEVSYYTGDFFILDEKITFRSKSRLSTDYFTAEMVVGSAKNATALAKAISDAKDGESF